MYEISYHKLVLKDDLEKVSLSEQKRILKILEKKLSFNPETFGKPLRKKLKGYYRLRIDPFRVVYKIDGNRVKVFVLKIGMRRNAEVYVDAAKRLGLI